MKQGIIIVLGLLIWLAGIGCQPKADQPESNNENPQVTQEGARWEEVMAMHDEVMPLMTDISEVRRNLKTLLGNPAANQKMLENTIQRLDSADESMMDWMYNFKQLENLQSQMDHSGIMQYLDGEYAKIRSIQDSMNLVISTGRVLLEQYKQEQ